ncbi:MAG: phenylacetate--CoA ligase family protein [Christensenellales bacterium]
MIWNKEIECAPQSTILSIQAERLRSTVQRVYDRVPFYRAKLDMLGIKPSHITSVKDLQLLPFTQKDDLRDHFPYGLFAVPMRDIVRIHASSGTTGKATVVGYTKNDLTMWAENIARIAVAGGATPDDIAQISFGYGLFTGAFGLHYGLENLGAAVVPVSSGNTERQVKIMQDFGSTLLVSTPSYAMYISEVAQKMGIDPRKLKVRKGLFGAEGHTEEMNRELEKQWDMVATENYGLSEIIGPGVSGECVYKTGMHINEDHFIVEVIDPDTCEVLPEGAEGEIVITPISKEALPLLRYRTHDISRLQRGTCVCGRTSMRMMKIKGRSDDMLIIRGVNVFPSQIESVLVAIEEVGNNYEIIVSKKGYLDVIEVLVEVSDIRMLESFRDLEALEKKVKDQLRTALLLDASVKLVEPSSLKRYEGKAKRVTDLR